MVWKNLTLDNLFKRSLLVYWCVMCKCSGENVDNLLLHCLVAMELWDFAKSLVIQLAPPVFPTNTCLGFKSPFPIVTVNFK